MKIVAVNGSPRKEGNTRRLLEKVLGELQKAGWETESIQLGGRAIHGCRACYACFTKQNRRCAFNDDEFNGLYEKLLSADAILLGSPTYFADVTPETKALIDRTGFVSMANGCLLACKIGAGVVAVRRGGAIHAMDSINHLFLISQMIIPGSIYWNMGLGLQPGEVLDDAMGLANMVHLGKAIDWLGKLVANSREPYPVHRAGEGD